MTALGKLMVIATLILSVGFGLTAVVLYMSQNLLGAPPAGITVPKNQTGGGPNRDQIEAAQRKAEVEQLQNDLRDSQGRWADGRKEVERLEQSYYGDKSWYQDELEKVNTSDKDLQRPAFDNGRVKVNLDTKSPEYGRPLLEPASDRAGSKPPQLSSAKVYRDKIATLSDQLEQQAKNLVKGVKDTIDLINEITSSEGPPPTKGYYRLLDDEIAKQKHVAEELDEVKDAMTKVQVDAELLLRRRDQMRQRVRELQARLGTLVAQP